MKICIIAYKFGTEKEIGEHLGTYHWFIEFTRRLVKEGHEVVVVAPWISLFKKGSLEVNGVKIIRYWPKFWYRFLAFPINKIWRAIYIYATKKNVLKISQKIKPDIFLVWQSRETGYAISQIKEKLSAPVLFRQIGAWAWHLNRSAKEVYEKRPWYQILKKAGLDKMANIILEYLLDKKNQRKFATAIYKKLDQIIFVSQIATSEGLALNLEKEKIVVQPVTIETELFYPLEDKQKIRQELGLRGDKILLFVGRLNFAEKGLGYLLEALKIAKEKISDLQLVIIGAGGEQERMLKMIKDLLLENNVQWVGKKPFNDLIKYFNAADVFIMSSIWMETFGQVTIEAMACGVPVIGFKAGATPEINLHEITGYNVESKNSFLMAEAIVKIFNDEEKRKKMGEAARQRVEKNYTFEVLIKDFINLVNQIKK
ncbi:MAG TPA: glycosyltransferase family 4 protein [bacterium]|nr:glycosyltransferase family 4 protein [bacterium]